MFDFSERKDELLVKQRAEKEKLKQFREKVKLVIPIKYLEVFILYNLHF